jgi:hypothetical protein
VLISFDLIELDGHDLRRERIEHRKARLAKLVRGPHPGITLHEHYEDDGEVVFQHACKLGWEGILSLPLSLGTLAALGEGQKSESVSRSRDNDRSLARSFSAMTARRFPPPRIG